MPTMMTGSALYNIRRVQVVLGDTVVPTMMAGSALYNIRRVQVVLGGTLWCLQ